AAEMIATSIVLVASALRVEVSEKAHGKCRTIYNGIDARAILETNGATPPLPFEREEGRAVVATVAAVTPFKGYHHLLAAARIVNERAGDARPVFISVGDLFDKTYARHLRGLATEYGLDNFHFLGWQQNPFAYYKLADVVVLPTVEREQLKMDGRVVEVRSGEGLPRTVLEAMYMAKPTVATRVAGTPEQILDGETGLLVPPANPEAIADAIMRLLEASPAERRAMGERARARVRENFTTARMVRETGALYRELLG